MLFIINHDPVPLINFSGFLGSLVQHSRGRISFYGGLFDILKYKR